MTTFVFHPPLDNTGWFSDLTNYFDSISGWGTSFLDFSTPWGIRNTITGVISTLGGNDIIFGHFLVNSNGFTAPSFGISNAGLIDMGTGNDTLRGIVEGGSNSTGILNSISGHIDLGTGNDTISGVVDSGNGIYNSGWIDTGDNDDTITGTTLSGGLVSGILNTGFISTGNGDDNIKAQTGGSSSFGLKNSGVIDLGSGHNTITGEITQGGNNRGIWNSGLIKGGSDTDEIVGVGKGIVSASMNRGITNVPGGTIFTGGGTDVITGTIDVITGPNYSTFGIWNMGEINTSTPGHNDYTSDIAKIEGSGSYMGICNGSRIGTGGGNNSIKGTGGNGISNSGLIETYSGIDVVTGTSTSTSGYGIYNDGLISTGAGVDTLTSVGDFGGNGKALLGAGNDTVNGFGSGNFDGGADTDTLYLPSLKSSELYTVKKINTVSAEITRTASLGNPGLVMKLTNFESLMANSGTFSGGLPNLGSYLADPANLIGSSFTITY